MREIQIQKLVLSFTEKTLPKSEWTHNAHIIVAFWHNWHFEFNDALRLVRERIIAYNEEVGTENSDTSGYHESITRFWMILTKNHLSAGKFNSIESACSEFFKSNNARNNIPLKYYSKEVLFSVKARKKWVNGDIMKIKILKEKTTANKV